MVNLGASPTRTDGRVPLTDEDIDALANKLATKTEKLLTNLRQQYQEFERNKQQKLEEHRLNIENAQQRIDLAQREKAVARLGIQRITADRFYHIFNINNNKSLTEQQKDDIFTKYNLQNSIELRAGEAGTYYKIHSMIPILTYLQENASEIKGCDFRAFLEITDIKPLISYLFNSKLIKAVAFQDKISDELKAFLSALERGTSIKIRYFS